MQTCPSACLLQGDVLWKGSRQFTKSSINDILYINTNTKPGVSIKVKLTCSLLKNLFPCSVKKQYNSSNRKGFQAVCVLYEWDRKVSKASVALLYNVEMGASLCCLAGRFSKKKKSSALHQVVSVLPYFFTRLNETYPLFSITYFQNHATYYHSSLQL